jgi:2,4-dienoyl-CoA reductase-like NADH-dependent reductase (Old Yellow Enzyme family)
MDNQSKLFQPFAVGETKLCHRVVMAPLTRARADENWVPTKLNSGTYHPPFIGLNPRFRQHYADT